MPGFTDSDGDLIEKGFYETSRLKELIYFTGEYNEDGLAVFDNRYNKTNGSNKEDQIKLTADLTARLIRVDEKYVKKIFQDLKEKTNWLEEILH